MKRFIATLSLLLLVLGIPAAATPVAHAQGQAGVSVGIARPDMIVPPQPYPNMLGEEQHYSVTFRGNGEAIVSMRASIANATDQPITHVALRVPRVQPDDIIAFQVIREPRCINYQPVTRSEQKLSPPVCIQYQEADYFQPWWDSTKYQKVRHDYRGDTIDISLSRSIRPGTNGSIILYYRAFGYAKRDIFGSWKYTFETLKVEDTIQTLSVGISTDSDLILRGAKGQVDYRFDAGVAEMKAAPMAAGAVANAQMDQFVQQIGYGTISKSASNLQPLDSYTVKGSYADSRLRLYGKELSVGILVAIIAIALVVLVTKRIITALAGGLAHTGKPQAHQNALMTDLLLVTGTSFLSSGLIVIGSIAIVAASRMFASMLPYDVAPLAAVFFVVIALTAYAFLFFGPAILIGVRRGLVWGFATAGGTLLWMLVYSIGYFMVLFFLAVSGYSQGPVIYPMRGVLEKMMGTETVRTDVQKSPAAVGGIAPEFAEPQ